MEVEVEVEAGGSGVAGVFPSFPSEPESGPPPAPAPLFHDPGLPQPLVAEVGGAVTVRAQHRCVCVTQAVCA